MPYIVTATGRVRGTGGGVGKPSAAGAAARTTGTTVQATAIKMAKKTVRIMPIRILRKARRSSSRG
jgi:hypothetical protein